MADRNHLSALFTLQFFRYLDSPMNIAGDTGVAFDKVHNGNEKSFGNMKG